MERKISVEEDKFFSKRFVKFLVVQPYENTDTVGTSVHISDKSHTFIIYMC